MRCISAPLRLRSIGARRLWLTPRLRFSRYAPSALRAQLPLARQLRLFVKRTEWQLPRQSGFAGPEAVADARIEAEAHTRVRVRPPTEPFTTMDHLSDPLSALYVILRTLDEADVLEGDVPEAPGAEEEDADADDIVFSGLYRH